MSKLNYQNGADFLKESERHWGRAIKGFVRGVIHGSDDDVWRDLAADLNGTYIRGNGAASDTVIAPIGCWSAALDTCCKNSGEYTLPFTRLRAVCFDPHSFRFTLCRAGRLTMLARWLGIRGIDVGEPIFDHLHVLRSNYPRKAKSLWSNSRTRDLAQMQPHINLELKPRHGWPSYRLPDGVTELRFTAEGKIDNPEHLRLLFKLFEAVLGELVRVGATMEQSPGGFVVE